MNWRSAVSKYGLYYPAALWQAGDVPGQFAALSRSQRWPVEQRDAQKLRRLNHLLDDAATHVPRYMNGALDDHRLTSLAALERLPFCTKQDIQSQPDRHRSTADLGRLVKKTTGGSTGIPVTIWKTRHAMKHELAATWRGYSWAGVGMGDRQARFWGVPFSDKDRWSARLTDFVCNRKRLSAFEFSEADLARYADELAAFRPRYFYGYVSMLVAFADYLENSGRRLPVGPQAIITTAEVLTEAHRRRLSSVFGVGVFNEYGCGELGTIAHECEAGRLHLSDENMVVEIVDGDRICDPGQSGEIVVTELNNLAMPLIRYRTGDHGTLAADPCPCGRTLPVVENIFGRAYDFIVNPEGKRFHSEFIMYIFEEIARKKLGIRQFQVVQTGPDAYRIRIVPAQEDLEPAKTLVRDRFHERVSAAASIDFEVVESIEREKSGKIRLIVGLPQGDSATRE